MEIGFPDRVIAEPYCSSLECYCVLLWDTVQRVTLIFKYIYVGLERGGVEVFAFSFEKM